ncbi:MAG: elongation factor Ts [Bacteroidetes bacterium]|nr:elongation factor Ts [Bacteroidota bacterium]
MSTATITASEINKLRQMTGAGMMDCRKALTETNGDFEAAIDWLRKKGQKVAALRGDRDAKEGVIFAKTTSDNKTGIVMCLSCETDFVSKNADFISFAESIIDAAIAHNVKSVEELNEVSINGARVADLVNDKLASIGEKIGISKFDRIDAAFVASYIHGTNRMGVLVGLNASNAEVGKDIAMQIAAMNPVAVDSSSVSAEVIEREKGIIMDLIKNDPKMAGKPEEMLSKIADGKLNAFFKESTLLAQAFVKDGGMSVGDYIKSKDSSLAVVGFKRINLG